LRRFKDGRIEESVVWDEGVKTGDDKMGVPVMIVKYILERHFGFGVSAENVVKSWQGSFDSVIRLPEVVARVVQNTGAPSGFKAAITAFDDLVKGIRALTDELPLSLSSISPASDYLRYTSVFSPLAFPIPPSTTFSTSLLPPSARYMPHIEIILQFEKSSRWPDDLRAIQKIKLAFFERIASALMSSIPTLKASVVIGDGSTHSEIIDQAHLEIVTEQGWAFSARIWHDREATLLDNIINDKIRPAHIKNKTGAEYSPSNAKERQEALEAREIYTRRFIHGPSHHRAIASLSHHFSAYAGTVRLVKRWLASHWLLQGHISEEVVEIICARSFVGDGKSLGIDSTTSLDHNAGVPGSKERGFAGVVEFLKDWKFEEGLFVPLYGSTDTTGLSDTAVTVNAGSNVGVWTVSTEVDKEGHVWTSQGPELIAALRVHALAKATWERLQGMEHGNLDVKVSVSHTQTAVTIFTISLLRHCSFTQPTTMILSFSWIKPSSLGITKTLTLIPPCYLQKESM
jgi:U3 small nucleolar RNA-associated protein 22